MRRGLALVAMVGLVALVAPATLTAEVSSSVTLTLSETPPALSLSVRQHNGKVAIELSGLAAKATEVSYLLEVTGRSHSRHRGRTTLAANVPARLSTMTVDAGEQWCVRLLAEEEGRDPYEIREGHCPEQD